MKSSEVSIKTRSTPASLTIQGQVTKDNCKMVYCIQARLYTNFSLKHSTVSEGVSHWMKNTNNSNTHCMDLAVKIQRTVQS